MVSLLTFPAIMSRHIISNVISFVGTIGVGSGYGVGCGVSSSLSLHETINAIIAASAK